MWKKKNYDYSPYSVMKFSDLIKKKFHSYWELV